MAWHCADPSRGCVITVLGLEPACTCMCNVCRGTSPVFPDPTTASLAARAELEARIINMVHDGTAGTLYEHAEVAVHATLGRLAEARERLAVARDALRTAMEMIDGEQARRQPRSGAEQAAIRDLRQTLRDLERRT